MIRQDVLDRLVRRCTDLERLTKRQARRLEEQRALLRTAVHELALEREIKPPERYYQRWLDEHSEKPGVEIEVMPDARP